MKAKVLTDLAQDFGLIETFRWSPIEGFVHLPMHLDRLEQSAAAMGFKADRPLIHAELARVASQAAADGGDARVRLLLHRDGRAVISTTPLNHPAPGLGRARLSEHRVDPADLYLRHKTTLRELFDTELDRTAAAGLDEVIFLNRRGEVTEASRHSVFVRIEGRLITPPLACGLLPGVLRRRLLECGEAFEGVLAPGDLKRAETLYLGNSLRGLRRFVLEAA